MQVTVIILTPHVLSPNGVQLAENGEPCYIINVTIRNDYSTLMYVWLTAQIFNGENQINATDLLLNGLPPSSGAMVGLNSGESGNLFLIFRDK